MENLITDKIKALEEGLLPLIERVNKFKFLPKNSYSKEELEPIIKQIEALPQYTEEELNTFVSGLNILISPVEEELLALIEYFKETPKKHQHEIRAAIKALKHQPQMSKKEMCTLEQHLQNFPDYTEEELAILLEYIKIFPQNMEEEIHAIIRDIKRLPRHNIDKSNELIKQIDSKVLSEQTKEGLINFISRVVLIKQLYFLESIKHLEKRSKVQLFVLLNIIRKHIPSCGKIVLFGSYARGTEIIYDVRNENGGRVSFQSDFDIMIVLPDPATIRDAHEIERNVCSKIKTEYNEYFLDWLHAPPQFVVECEHSLRGNLEIQHPFFKDIIKDGVVLFDTGKISFSKPKELSYKVKKEVVEDYFNTSAYHANCLIKFAKSGYNDGDYTLSSFLVHQACEKYYRGISMVFSNYHPKLHDLEELVNKTTVFSPELASVFPRITAFEDRAFKLLRDAYIDARYNMKFIVTKEELAYMLERVDLLKEIANRICKERIAYYDMMAQTE